MDGLIQQMRQDFNRLMAFRLDNGEWTKADANEHGLAIRAIIAGKDAAMINAWAGWVAGLAADYTGHAPALIVTHAPACQTCINLTKPGRSDTGYCDQRPDQPPAYGAGHPLHQLPKDQGASCALWRLFE